MTAAWEVIPPRAVITPLQYFDFTISTISGEISSWQKINCSLFSINFSASSLKKQISPTPTPALAAIPVPNSSNLSVLTNFSSSNKLSTC